MQQFKKIPLIFNSSISDKFSASKGKEIGAEAYLVKFDARVFLSMKSLEFYQNK